MASEIAELIPFLTENRKEVRKVALDHVWHFHSLSSNFLLPTFESF